MQVQNYTMRLISRVFLFGLLALAVGGCFDEPKFPDTPQIAFKDIQFKVTPDISIADTLSLFIDFKDGDGNLGLDANDPNDFSDPYNNDTYYQEGSDGKLVPVQTFELFDTLTVLEINDTAGPLVNYRTRSKKGFSNLPALDPDKVGCLNYTNTLLTVPFDKSYADKSHIIDSLRVQVVSADSPPDVRTLYILADTLYFQTNENHYNLTIQFFVQDASGSGFTEFNWRDQFCTTFDGRFPILSDNAGKPGPLEGTIRYDMPSVGFIPLFGNKRMKLRFYIRDRDLNQSNVVETPEFNLTKIKK